MQDIDSRKKEIQTLNERTGVSLEILEGLPQGKLREYFNQSAEAPPLREIAIDAVLALGICAAGSVPLFFGMPFEDGPGVVISFGLAFAMKAAFGVGDRRENAKLAAQIRSDVEHSGPKPLRV